MADQNKGVVRTLIGYKLDKPSFDEAIAAQRAIAAESRAMTTAINTPAVKALSDNFAGLSPRIQAARGDIGDMRQGLASYNVSIDDVDKKTISWIGDLQKLRSEIVGVKEASAGGIGDLGGGAVGAGGLGAKLKAIGFQGRQLPATQTPFGFSTDTISNMVRMTGAIIDAGEKAGISANSFKVMGVAAGALAVAVLLAKAQFDATKKAADAANAGRQKAIDLLNEGTREEQQARINELKIKRDSNAAQLALAFDLLTKMRQQIIAVNGGGVEGTRALGFAEIGAQIGLGAGELKSAEEAFNKYNEAVKENTVELDLLTGQTGLAAQGAADLAAAEGRLIEERNRIQFTTSDIQNRLTADIEAYTLAQTGSSDALKARQDALQTEIALTENASAAALYKLQTEKLSEAEQQNLVDIINDLTEKSNAAKTSLNFISQEFVNVAISAREAKEAADKLREDQAKAAQKFIEDVKALNEKKNESEIDLWNKLIDKQVSIADKAADDIQKALDALTTKEASLGLGITRALEDQSEKAQFDALQRQIKFNRQEVVEEQKVQQRIAEIRQQAAENEFELGLDRDFAGLARSRRQTAQQIAQVNQQAQLDRQARLQAFQDQSDDAQAQFIFERQQKLQKYQQDLDDARAAESAQLKAIQKEKEKQLIAARTAYAKEYAAIQDKYNREMAQRQVAIQTELNQIAAGEAGKLQIITTYAQAAQQILSGIFDVSTLPSTSGTSGGTSGSQTPIPTPLIGAGGSTRGGFPTRTPFIGGAASGLSNNQSVNVSIPVTINGGDPNAIAAKMYKVARDVTADTLERMNRR